MNPLHFPPYDLRNLYHSALLFDRQKRGRMLLLFGFLSIIASLFASCENSRENEFKLSTHKGEYIGRSASDRLEIPPLKKVDARIYPWEKKYVGNFPKLTKEYFRCKGKCLNPNKLIGDIYVSDCEGNRQHSLPLRNDKEFIYPILIRLLNYVQAKTEKQVIVTSGHRCPAHNRYVDSSPKNEYSKHMLGAEADFYVRGMEHAPEKVVEELQAYFRESPEYNGLKEYQEFQRWEKSECGVTTLPWYNKEVFIKLYKPHEGRNHDNAHPFPYIAIQVRYDREKKERVLYSWEQASCYWRY